jgi:hypothetical protein
MAGNLKRRSFSQIIRDMKHEFLKYRVMILISLFLFALANIITYLASMHVDTIKAVAVPDLILDNIPTLNLNFIFVYGFYAMIILIIFYVVFFHMKDAHKIILQFSLLMIIRSFFMVLTHLSVPLDAQIVTGVPTFLKGFYFVNDLFFSGHTSVPFLAFLLFRREKMGILFLGISILMAITVLFMHVHYSIDVFAAFFITYGSYKLGSGVCRQCEKLPTF